MKNAFVVSVCLLGAFAMLGAAQVRETEPNDGLLLANPLGILSEAGLHVTGSIDPAGDLDFFSFTVPEGFEGIVELVASGPLGGDAALVLYGFVEALDRIAPIESSSYGKTTPYGLIFMRVDPGEYFVRLGTWEVEKTLASYDLKIHRWESSDLGELVMGGALQVEDTIEAGGLDAFMFTLSEPALVVFETSGEAEGDSVILLFGADGKLSELDIDSGEGTWSRLAVSLEAGEHTLAVLGFFEDDAFPYSLSVSAEARPRTVQEVEPNDTLEQAMPVGAPVVWVLGEIARPFDVDYYAFDLDTARTVRIETTGQDGDSVLYLFDEDETQIAYDDDGGRGYWSLIVIDLEPGRYFVRVEGYSDDTFAYTLKIE